MPGIFCPGLKKSIFNCSLCLLNPLLPLVEGVLPCTVLLSPQTEPVVKNRLAYSSAV